LTNDFRCETGVISAINLTEKMGKVLVGSTVSVPSTASLRSVRYTSHQYH